MTDNLLEHTTEADAPAKAEVTKAEVENTVSEKPATLPDKFWDAAKGTIRLQELIQSYLELEKRLSKSVPVPETEEDKFRICRMMGMPDTPEDYQFTMAHGLFEPDEEINRKMHAMGFTKDQAQLVYDMAAEKLVPMILEMAGEFEADREVERLVRKFGGTEKWQEVSRQLLAFGRKNLPPDVLNGLSGSYEGIMALYRMMQGTQSAFATKDDAGTAALTEEDLFTMMQDPRYWQKKDPGFVNKITRGFQQLYGQNG